MALDYHIRSREIDINDTAAEELSNLNGEAESKTAAIMVRLTVCLPRLSLSILFLCHPIIRRIVSLSLTFTCRNKVISL